MAVECTTCRGSGFVPVETHEDYDGGSGDETLYWLIEDVESLVASECCRGDPGAAALYGELAGFLKAVAFLSGISDIEWDGFDYHPFLGEQLEKLEANPHFIQYRSLFAQLRQYWSSS